jgi:hypothetical protein
MRFKIEKYAKRIAPELKSIAFSVLENPGHATHGLLHIIFNIEKYLNCLLAVTICQNLEIIAKFLSSTYKGTVFSFEI